MQAIGIDTHKDTLAACRVDDAGAVLDERTFSNDPAGHRAVLDWVRVEPTIVGIEGSASFGATLARFLVAAGLTVREVPPQLSHRERRYTRRAGKSDPGDALAIARVTLREADLPPVRVVDRSLELQQLMEARDDLVGEQTRVRNRLHADLRTLLPGYGAAAANLTATRHQRTVGRLLRPLRGVQAELARDRLVRVGRLTVEIDRLTRRIDERVAGHPVLRMPGVGVLVAARFIADTGDIRRFRSPDALASLAGVAPIPASSGQTRHMRLNRGGNRRLNRALYTVAIVQAAHHPAARAYLARKRAEGKTGRDAIRALKRQLVRPIFRLLIEGTEDQRVAA